MRELFQWQTRGRRDCPRCACLEGIRLPLEAWQALCLPGFHPGCDCELLPVRSTAAVSASPGWASQPAAVRFRASLAPRLPRVRLLAPVRPPLN